MKKNNYNFGIVKQMNKVSIQLASEIKYVRKNANKMTKDELDSRVAHIKELELKVYELRDKFYAGKSK